MTQFLHGVEVIEIDDGSRPITTVKSAVIGLVGTAPNSAAAIKATLTVGSTVLNDGLTFTAVTAGNEGNAISIEFIKPDSDSADLALAVDGKKISVNLATDATKTITSTPTDIVAAIDVDDDAKVLVTASVLGSGDEAVTALSAQYLSGGEQEAFPLNKPVAVAGSPKAAEALGTAGTLPAAIDDIFDLLNTENELFESRKAYLAAHYSGIVADYRLLNSTGLLLNELRVAIPDEWARSSK